MANVARALDKAQKLFYWGDWAEGRYIAKRARLQAIKEEIESATPSVRLIDTTSVLGAWNSGDPTTRHELLETLFDGIFVENEEVTGYRPRGDRASEVAVLIEGLLGAEREGFEPSNEVAPVTAFPVPRPRPD